MHVTQLSSTSLCLINEMRIIKKTSIEIMSGLHSRNVDLLFNYRIYSIERPQAFTLNLASWTGVYLTPEARLSSLFMKQWVFFIIVYRH